MRSGMRIAMDLTGDIVFFWKKDLAAMKMALKLGSPTPPLWEGRNLWFAFVYFFLRMNLLM